MTSFEKSRFYPPPLLSLFVTFSSSKIPSATFSVLIRFVDFSIACGAAPCTIVILVNFIRYCGATCGGHVLSWFLLNFFSRLRRENLKAFFFCAQIPVLSWFSFFSVIRRDEWRPFTIVILALFFVAPAARQEFVRQFARLLILLWF